MINNPKPRKDGLAAAGCDEMFIDKAVASWSELDKALIAAREAEARPADPSLSATPSAASVRVSTAGAVTIDC